MRLSCQRRKRSIRTAKGGKPELASTLPCGQMDGMKATNTKDDDREQKGSSPPLESNPNALAVAIPSQQGEVIEVANPPSPDAMSEMTEYTHLVSEEDLHKVAGIAGDAITVTTAASTATAGTGPPRASDETASRIRIEWARQKLAAQKRGDGQALPVGVHTAKAHYRRNVDKLKLRAMLNDPNVAKEDIVDHAESMGLNNKEYKPDDLAIIEEVDETDAQLDSIIRQRFGEEGVKVARKKEAIILSAMAATSALLQTNTNRSLELLESNLIESTKAGFKETRKGLKDVQNEVELSRVRLEHKADKQSAALGDMSNMEAFTFRQLHGPEALSFVKGLQSSGGELDDEAFSRIDELSARYNAAKSDTKPSRPLKNRHPSNSRNKARPLTSNGATRTIPSSAPIRIVGGRRNIAPDSANTRDAIHLRCATKTTVASTLSSGKMSGSAQDSRYGMTAVPGMTLHVDEEADALKEASNIEAGAAAADTGTKESRSLPVDSKILSAPLRKSQDTSSLAQGNESSLAEAAGVSINEPEKILLHSSSPRDDTGLSSAIAESRAVDDENCGIMARPGKNRHSIHNALSQISSNSNQTASDEKEQEVVLQKIISCDLSALKRDFRISVDGMKSADWRENKASMEIQSRLCRSADATAARMISKFYCQQNCDALSLLTGCLLKDQSQVITAASQTVCSYADMVYRNPRPSEKGSLKNVSIAMAELLGASSKLSGSCASESIATLGHECLQALANATGRHTYLHGIVKILVDCTDKTILKNESRMFALSESLVTILNECAAAPALVDMERKGSLMVRAVKECIEHKNQDVRNNGMAAYAKMSKRKEFCPLADAVILSVGHKYRGRLGRYS